MKGPICQLKQSDDGEILTTSNQGNDVIKLNLFLEMKRLILEYINWRILKYHMLMTMPEVK